MDSNKNKDAKFHRVMIQWLYIDFIYLQGDSGGPLVCNHGTSPELRGVTSWGVLGCSPSYPSVYARLYNEDSGVNLKDWICANAPGAGGC